MLIKLIVIIHAHDQLLLQVASVILGHLNGGDHVFLAGPLPPLMLHHQLICPRTHPTTILFMLTLLLLIQDHSSVLSSYLSCSDCPLWNILLKVLKILLCSGHHRIHFMASRMHQMFFTSCFCWKY